MKDNLLMGLLVLLGKIVSLWQKALAFLLVMLQRAGMQEGYS